MPDISCVS